MSNVVYADVLPKGLVVGFNDKTIVVGTKKVFTETEEVLMEVAKQKLNELENNNEVYESEWCGEEKDKVMTLFHELRNMMPAEDLKRKLMSFDSATCDHNAAFGESQFIQGYLEGYEFAKQMLENKKERTAATVRSF
jgi:hypothetical protein